MIHLHLHIFYEFEHTSEKGERVMATWKSVQDSIKQSMKQLGELYEAQAQERKDFQVVVQNQAKEQLAQFQQQLVQYKKQNDDLRKEVERLREEVAQRDVYIQGLEENRSQEDLDETFPMPISNTYNEITQEDSLSDTLKEAQRREEERLAKEAEAILAAQKEKERAYQLKLERENREREQAQQKRQQEQERQVALAQQEQAQKDEQRALLEREYAEASAKLSLAQKERESDSSIAALNDRFEQAKSQVSMRLTSLKKEYEEAKRVLQENSAREIEALSVGESTGQPDEKEQNAQSELASLETKVDEIDTQLNGFFVRNRKRLEQEREAHNQRIDELNTLLLYLRNQKNLSVGDSRNSEKVDEINRRMDMFEQQWQERMSAVQQEVNNEFVSLNQQYTKEEAAIEKRWHTKIQKLEEKKSDIEKQIELLS